MESQVKLLSSFLLENHKGSLPFDRTSWVCLFCRLLVDIMDEYCVSICLTFECLSLVLLLYIVTSASLCLFCGEGFLLMYLMQLYISSCHNIPFFNNDSSADILFYLKKGCIGTAQSTCTEVGLYYILLPISTLASCNLGNFRKNNEENPQQFKKMLLRKITASYFSSSVFASILK